MNKMGQIREGVIKGVIKKMPKNLLSLQQAVGYLSQIFLSLTTGIFSLQEKLSEVFLDHSKSIDFEGFKFAASCGVLNPNLKINSLSRIDFPIPL